MRNYTWQMFEVTGDVEAYLLYRACDMCDTDADESVERADAYSQADPDEPLT